MEERRRPGQPGAGDPRRQRPAQRPDAQRRAPAEGASRPRPEGAPRPRPEGAPRPRPEGAQRARQPGEAPRSAQRSTNPRRRPQKKESILKKYNINIKQFPIPGWIFLPLMVLFCELHVFFWTMEEFNFIWLLTVVMFSLGLGFLLSLITSLLPPKAAKWTTVGISFVLLVVYIGEYFIQQSFGTFMAVGTILAGGEGVATDYRHVVINIIITNLWRIFYMLLPVILYAVFAKPDQSDWKQRLLIAADAVLLYVVGFGIIYAAESDVSKLNVTYEFTSATRAFGLQMAFVLDAAQSADTGVSFEQMDYEQQDAATLPSGFENPERPVVIEPHTMGLDFAALAEDESDGNIKKLHEYIASQTPTNTNAYTGLFKGKNLIFITAEAFCGEIVDPELTPALYRLIHEGIYFSDYYQPAWGAGTIGGEYTNVVGLMPVNGKCMQEANQQDLFFTIGKQLQKEGYASGAYHNNTYTYYDRNTTHTYLGYDVYVGYGNGMENGVSKNWPQSDLEMFQYIIPQYLEQSKPFSLYFMSVSGHSNYSRGGNAMSRKNYSIVEDLDYSEQLKCYIAANLELEYALQFTLNALEEAGKADDTVIVISADHYPYGLEKSSAWGNDEEYLDELFGETCDSEFVRDQNALVIWSGCVEDMNIEVSAPTYSLDILPTLSNLFGVEYDSRLMVGRDVFSTDEAIIFFGGAGSWKTEKGTYSSRNNKFTPAEGVEVEDGYVKRINTIVRNKISYCKNVAKYDYFNYVADALKDAKGE